MKLDPADIHDLQPVIAEVVKATLAEIAADDSKLGNGERIGLTEAEAAAALGIQRHVLADARRRGEVHARRVGKKYVYSREALARFLCQAGE